VKDNLPVAHFIFEERVTNNLFRSYCTRLRDAVMSMCGISHIIDTKVGDELVRGVSGGERKRVTIAEATLAEAPLQCWDK